MNIKQTPASEEYQKEVTAGITRLMKAVMEHKQKVENYESDSLNTQLEDLPGEIWKDIEGFEGIYQVSNKGRIKSLKYWHGKSKTWSYRSIIMKPAITKCGYLRVDLWKDGKAKHYLIHRLVAQAFIPNPNEYLCVNHKDECKTNNTVENLEWCTHQYNTNYGTAIERTIEHNRKPVSQFDAEGNFIRSYCCADEAAKILNINSNAITTVANGNHCSSGGFFWEYTTEEHKPGYILPIDKLRKIRLATIPVSQFDKNGNFISNYNSIQEAADNTNISRSAISRCLIDKIGRHSAGGFIWRPTISTYVNGYKLPPDKIPKIGIPNEDRKRPLKVYDRITNQFICEGESICDAARKLHLKSKAISSAINSGRMFYKNYKFELIDKK